MNLINNFHSPSIVNVPITGIGWISAVNAGRGSDRCKPEWDVGTPTVPAAMLKSLKGGSRFGRLDLFSRIGVAAIGLALEDAGYLPAKQPAAETSIALISATTSSCGVTDRDFYRTIQEEPGLASPGLFVYTLATSFLGEAALRFSLTGAGMTVLESQPRADSALKLALEELITGDDEVVVAGICNLFAQTSAAPRYSGALFLVLEKETQAPARVHAVLSCDLKTGNFYINHQPCPDIFSICERICG